ncbi:MAG TPA: SAM-dependent methyltransferase [Streptosporangiaceae bacterium]|nr:SAM-dependent methyltransferase [Streptosporangiaceae bacterium]
MTGQAGDATAQVEALLSPRGQELLDRVAAASGGAEPALAMASRLRREYPPDLVAAATAQHELRLAARPKFSRAMRMLFTRPGLEQASSEASARHRARRYADAACGRLADLGCGIGGDLIALAAGREVLAVDRDAVHLRMAVHNAGVYDAAAGVRACRADARDVDLGGVDAVFTDPARRGPGAGGRRFRPGESEPPLEWCFALESRIPAVGIKAAPGLPARLVPPGWETEFVAFGRDLKEAVLWSPALATAPARATILPESRTLPEGQAPVEGSTLWPEGHTLLPEPGPDVPVAPPGQFLFDPNPAVTRAGLVEDLARRLGAWKVDPRIAFLSADADRRTPFARTLRVIESAPWNEKHFARRLRALGIGAADLRRRGLAGDVDQIHRRLRLSGPHRATVVLTRVDDRPWGLICTEPDAS